MPFAKAGMEAIPRGKIDAANISPLAALTIVQGSVDTFFIRMPFVISFL